MLSRALIWCPQPGQCDAGETIDSPRGRRQITTLRKLPQQAPMSAAYIELTAVKESAISGDIGRNLSSLNSAARALQGLPGAAAGPGDRPSGHAGGRGPRDHEVLAGPRGSREDVVVDSRARDRDIGREASLGAVAECGAVSGCALC